MSKSWLRCQVFPGAFHVERIARINIAGELRDVFVFIDDVDEARGLMRVKVTARDDTYAAVEFHNDGHIVWATVPVGDIVEDT